MPPSTVDLDRLGRTIDQIFSLDELKSRLALKRPLRIKYGVDVTAPFLHIGHAVNLWMMRYLQECGHKVVFLIGDFTTRIGDPTGKSAARHVPEREAIEANAQEFIKQVGQVLLTDPAVFEVRRNSEWFDKMGVDEFLRLLSHVTHSRLIQRDMFQRRIEQNAEIYMHEMLYPILQGYDSAMLESDLTIVGSDQLFNEMMGRFYQEKKGQLPQVVVTTQITPGTDGKQKQSKSLGNYIALADTPRDKFGKAMSIPDELTADYLRVYTRVPLDEIGRIQRLHPMEAKKQLAAALVELYHGPEAAKAERAWFEEAFSARKSPDDIPTVEVAKGASLLEVLEACLKDRSRSDLRRLVQGGGVRLNETKLGIDAVNTALDFKPGDTLKAGKTQWFKLAVKS